MEYDAYYTHVGGSEAAKSYKIFYMADLDAMSCPAETFGVKKAQKNTV